MEKVRVVDVGLEELDRHPASWYAGEIIEVPDGWSAEDWVKNIYRNVPTRCEGNFKYRDDTLLEYLARGTGEPRYVYVTDDVDVPRKETKLEARANKKSVFELLVNLRIIGYDKIIDDFAAVALWQNAISWNEYYILKHIDEDLFDGTMSKADVKEGIDAGYKFHFTE